MLKLVKYLKKSWLSIVMIILLLIFQAMCDLSLPDYTSKIVNVGVQQGGVEEVAPKVIRESELEKIKIFLNEEDQKTVNEHYKLIDKGTLSENELSSYKDKYKEFENITLYELNTINQEIIDDLSKIMGKPMLIISGLTGTGEETEAMKQGIIQNLPPEMQNMDIFEVFKIMPQEQLSKVISGIDENISSMPESIVSQSAVIYVNGEYKAIGMDMEKLQSDYIWMAGLKMLGIALISMLATILVGFLGAKVAAKLGKDLRSKVFEKVISFSESEFKQYSTASLITRSTNDIQQIQMIMVMLFRTVFYAPILGIGGVIKVLNTNTTMAWIIAVAVMAILMLIGVLFAIVLPKFKVVQKLIDKLNLVTREILSGLPVIRAFSREKHEEQRFDNANEDLTKTNLFVNRVMSCMMPAMMFIMNGICILIVWNSAYSISDGLMQIGDMMAFIQYTMQIIMSFLMISMLGVMLPRASVSANRITEVLNTKLVIKDVTESKKPIVEKKGQIEFKDVYFRYPDADEDVIRNISFTAKPGETTAFIGSTGSGKSTVINLIPRFFDVTSGNVYIDGVNIRDIKEHDLREKIGYIPQNGILFSGTVESNIKYGDKELSDEAMKQAAKIAQATDFIEKLQEKYESPISQGGTNVSGGQKQRLSIARAIAIDPEIFIFDDSFSALDFKTDANLRAALSKITAEKTVLIVAQRISTIMNAEQIIVLDEGQIVGKGTHKELLKNCEVYREIAQSQLTKGELENE